MYAQIGTIVFEPIEGFTSFEASRSAALTQHDRINSKPRLHKTGMGLESVTVRIGLHAAFTNPEARINEIRAAHDTKEPMPLIMGSGRVRGEYTIADYRETWRQTDGLGHLISAEVELTLTECGDPDKLAQKQRAAKALAQAVKGGRVSPGVLGAQAAALKSVATGPQATIAAAFAATGKAIKVIGLIGKVAQDPSKMGEIGRKAAGIDSSLGTVAAALDTGAAVYNGVQAARTSLNRMRQLAKRAEAAAKAKNVGALDALSKDLLSTSRGFSRGMAPLGAMVAARKV